MTPLAVCSGGSTHLPSPRMRKRPFYDSREEWKDEGRLVQFEYFPREKSRAVPDEIKLTLSFPAS